jgi:hypothetical protein
MAASDEGLSNVVDNVQLQAAVQVMRNVPDALLSFTFVDALECVGVSRHRIMARENYSTLKDLMKQMMAAYNQSHGSTSFPDDQEAKVVRTVALNRLVKRMPSNVGEKKKKTSKAELMRLAGCSEKESSAGRLYMACTRAINADKGPPSRIEIQNNPQTSAAVVVSPMSCDVTGQTASTASQSSRTFSSPSSGSETVSSTSNAVNEPDLLVIPTRQGRTATFSSLMNGKPTRKTTHQMQVARREEQEEQDLYNLAFRLGTILLQSVTEGECNLQKLTNADMIAEEVNIMLGIHFVSGRELTLGVKNGQVGLNPKPRGAPRKVPDDDFKDVCALALTASAIEQANADPNRFKEGELCSLIGQIVNDKIERDGGEPLNDRWLHERVKKRNANVQNVTIVDKREALRVKWVTYQTQLLHHINFEKFVVEKQFARLPNSEEEQAQEGHVVYFEGQESRFINFDECQLTLDGTDESAGGRPASTASHTNVPECGASSNKSAKKCTLMMGIAGDEALPPFFIYPSMAKTSAPRLQWEILLPLPQIHAQYGYKGKKHFDVPFACNEKGGMDAHTFKAWAERCLFTYFPDAADEPGKRCIAKSDSGPGRQCVEYLMEARVDGWFQYPGVPNGTEVGQEMDQLFAAFKKIAYENRDLLYKARWTIEGEKAMLSKPDCGRIVFGGTVELSDGSQLQLKNAYKLAFTAEKIRRARVKCGYCPATRNALMSDRIRHEVYMNDNGVDEERDPLGVLYDELEKQNHDVVDALVSKGYTSAIHLRRCIDRISARQVEGRESVSTEPHTREHQDLLMRASTAGQFFRATQGGGALNCSDALLGYARRDMHDKADVMEKKKKDALKYEKDARHGWTIYDRKPNHSTWNVGEMRSVIRWLQGLAQPEGEKLNNMNKPGLQALYLQKYRNVQGSRLPCWTRDEEHELERLRAGEISSFEETAIYGKAVETLNEYLVTKLMTISSKRRDDVLAKVFERLPERERDDIASILFDCHDQTSRGSEVSNEANNDVILTTSMEYGNSDSSSTEEDCVTPDSNDPSRASPRNEGSQALLIAESGNNREATDAESSAASFATPPSGDDSSRVSGNGFEELHDAGRSNIKVEWATKDCSLSSAVDDESSQALLAPAESRNKNRDETDEELSAASFATPPSGDDSIRVSGNGYDEPGAVDNVGSHLLLPAGSGDNSNESIGESSQARFATPNIVERQEAPGCRKDGHEATIDPSTSSAGDESTKVLGNGHDELDDADSRRLQLLNRIGWLEKKKERQVGQGCFLTDLEEADKRSANNGKNLRVKDFQVLLEARGEEYQASGKRKKESLREHWNLVKGLPVTWKPWTNADDRELEELKSIAKEC